MVGALWLTLFLSFTLNAQILPHQAINNRQINQAHVHSSQPADVIDGAKQPELIPDAVAYRLYFVTVSETPNASREAQQRQLAYLSKVGLKDNDLQWTISILENFKTKYNDLVAEYNKSAVAAEKEGGTPDYQTFAFHRDELVRVTREDLRSFLTADGIASLDAHVSNEKRHMKVGLREVQP